MTKLKENTGNFVKGFGMGAANVIPGVSGGTIALITGIFERLIDSLKSFDITAIKLLFKGKFKEFSKHTDLIFLITVFFGALVSIMTLAKVLEFLFENYPIFIWSYFFGLITIEKWNFIVILTFLIGATIAVIITVLNPAKENSSFIYLILCGVAGVSSMILPGLSGSFILILMGNYELVMIDAVNNLTNALKGDFSTINEALIIIAPVGIGVVLGLLVFSHLLSWVYKKYKNQTIALLTGFILGSLAILWPWKNSFDKNSTLIETDKFGKLLVTEDIKVFSFERFFPNIDALFLISGGIALVGILTIWLIEKTATSKESLSED